MQVSLKWINELVGIKIIKLDDLIERLTLGGFEVEEILELEINNQNHIILDISATANRSDSLSIQGLSTEISSLLNQQIKNSNYSLPAKKWKQNIQNYTEIISSNSNYSLFLAVIIKNLTTIIVPKWIKQKLISSGITPTNNLLDFQNYVLLETGYPFEVYDFEKISNKLKTSEFSLSLLDANENQKFLASNNLEYELDKSILTVKANESIISIAGIIPAQDFAYSETTNQLLIEGSIFSAAKIRQQSRKLGLRTDRSARYEKSLKNTYLIESLYRLISLLRIANPNLICKLHTINQVKTEIPDLILLKYKTVNEILGPINNSSNSHLNYVTPEMITNYLTRLNFKFIFDEIQLIWKVEIPQLRTEDLTREIDLIEEIGRLHGFNNFLTTLPKLKTVGNEDFTYKTRKKITTCLLNLGFTELIHYSLVNQETFLKNEIQLVNPLLSDCSNLRSSLLPNLIKTLQENLKQKNRSIEGFEYGHVFSCDEKKNFKEKEYVSGIFGGITTKLSWSRPAIPLTWFEAKGKIEQLFNQLNLLTYWQTSFSKETKNLLHPYRSAALHLSNGTLLGYFGQIHPILSNRLSLSSSIYLFEFDIEVIENQLQKNKLALYKEYPLYPKVIKDLSFIIQQDIPFKKIQDMLYYNGTKYLSEIFMLDDYTGQSIPKQQKSLCLQLIFQSKEKTLENKEIETIINNLQFILINKFNATIRN